MSLSPVGADKKDEGRHVSFNMWWVLKFLYFPQNSLLLVEKIYIVDSNVNQQPGPSMLCLIYRMSYENSDLKSIILTHEFFREKSEFVEKF